MISDKRVLALIPARAGSKGLAKKNLVNFCGKPLIAWTVEQARACLEIDSILVSTDSAEIAEVSLRFGAQVPFIRPDSLATDTASSCDVILHALDFLEKNGIYFDIVVLLEPTSPLRESSDISGALTKLVDTPGLGSVVGVSKTEGQHPQFLFQVNQGYLRSYLNKNPKDVRRQDVEQLFFLEGSVYVSYVNVFREKRSFYHENTGPWEVARYKSIEIDELSDLVAAEALLLARQQGRF